MLIPHTRGLKKIDVTEDIWPLYSGQDNEDIRLLVQFPQKAKWNHLKLLTSTIWTEAEFEKIELSEFLEFVPFLNREAFWGTSNKLCWNKVMSGPFFSFAYAYFWVYASEMLVYLFSLHQIMPTLWVMIV